MNSSIHWMLAGWLAVSTSAAQAEAPERGRDPWAFRMILENKTRMLVLALRPDLWAAYNPANGTLHKVWSGGIQFHGKVYDFGQQNSSTQGVTYYLLEDAFLLTARDESVIPVGWTASGIITGSAWSFSSSPGTTMISPTVDLRRHDQVTLAYQTPGANNRLWVDVSTDGGSSWTAQSWMSIDGAVADGHQKRVAVTGDQVKFRFRRNATGSTATLADVTLFGDYQAWSLEVAGQLEHPRVDWRGYRLIDSTEGIVILYDLVLESGARVAVEESPEALEGASLERRFTVTGLPTEARLSLELDGVGVPVTHEVSGDAALRSELDETYLDFSNDGEARLETHWTP
ncbi:hypothetical protein HNR46_003864 [Haloferula luteola]|uniref:Uncharacterized protein n=1 Tax=Haloferula luteola TaxID=595692 RepID=A0A840V7B5_9BACT|nr:hypothetical protein [Haloferula luteola]MBB5353603.1 hypothetical protein [Haloferula luteola]